MITLRSLSARFLLLLSLACMATVHTSLAGSPVIVPDTGTVAIRLRALDVAGPHRVLIVSLRPGDEDLATAAYLRFHAGANVVSAYLTNGESGESVQGDLLPGEIAALRRNETFAALNVLGVDANFLDFPDPGSVSDPAEVKTFWGIDTLATKLEALIAAVRPHVIILSRDRDGGNGSKMHTYLLEFLKTYFDPTVVRKNTDRRVSEGGQRWRIERLWSETEDGTGITVATDRVNQTIGRSYSAIARSLEASSFTGGWRSGRTAQPGRYTLVRPAGAGKVTDLLEHVDLRIPASLARVCAVVRNFAVDVQKGKGQRGTLQERMVTIMDSVDAALATQIDRTGTAMRILIDLKGGLELLRNALLGVTADVSISEDILTDRQLTHVQITQVTGRDEAGTTEVYFPATERGWVLNEGLKSRLPLTIPGEYRLITPEHVTYDLPWAQNNLRQPIPVRPVMLFLLHRGGTRARSFVYRIELPIRYAPRLTLEVLTPLVRMIPGERVIVRLTNHSRDGIRDEVSIDDSLAVSSVLPFRLTGKEQSITDTLLLNWKTTVAEGTHILPLRVGSTVLAQCAVRQFNVIADTTLRVTLLTGFVSSPTAEALRRLGLAHVRITRSRRDLMTSGGHPDLLIVDRRATSLIAAEMPSAKDLDSLSRQGTHVIILSQDDIAWKARPLWPAIVLKRDALLGTFSMLESDTLHPMVKGPNRLTGDDLTNWVFASGYNTVSVSGGAAVERPFRSRAGHPLVVTQPAGNGRMTYVDLALAPQWMSIHPGSFRILANLLSLGGPAREGAR